MIELRGVHKSFGELHVLRGIDMEVRKGEVLCVIGPSGSGKSTMLRCINLLIRPDEGVITLEGVRINAPHIRPEWVRERVGMVFQSFNLFTHLTARENVALGPRRVKHLGARDARERAKSELERVGLADKLDAYPAQLSGGQQQRVAIARALAMDPKVMLFDEPTSALDPEFIREVLDVMSNLAGEGMTMVVVTHEMGFARYVAHSVVFIDEGLVLERGAPEEVLERPRHERTKMFVGKILR